MKPLTRSLRAILLTALLLQITVADARVIHRERSLYQTILVTQVRSRLCLQFSVRREQRNQSCKDTSAPQEMLFPYTRMMMAALLLNPDPQRVLIVGLGGGTLPAALAELYPNAHFTVVEIDPAVVKVARDYFDYQPSDHTEL
ncbi:MAG: spermidine synthase, partial [Pseudomonadales bacterium]